jgi:hypothetical protein
VVTTIIEVSLFSTAVLIHAICPDMRVPDHHLNSFALKSSCFANVNVVITRVIANNDRANNFLLTV